MREYRINGWRLRSAEKRDVHAHKCLKTAGQVDKAVKERREHGLFYHLKNGHEILYQSRKVTLELHEN